MMKDELKDHAIAHTIQQKQIERVNAMRAAEIEAFFEEEKLENAGREIVPCLNESDLEEFPVSTFEVLERHDEEDIVFNCSIC
jgi:hypothetical protein